MVMRIVSGYTHDKGNFDAMKRAILHFMESKGYTPMSDPEHGDDNVGAEVPDERFFGLKGDTADVAQYDWDTYEDEYQIIVKLDEDHFSEGQVKELEERLDIARETGEVPMLGDELFEL